MAPEMALPEEEILEVEDGVPPWVVLLRWAEVLLMALHPSLEPPSTGPLLQGPHLTLDDHLWVSHPRSGDLHHQCTAALQWACHLRAPHRWCMVPQSSDHPLDSLLQGRHPSQELTSTPLSSPLEPLWLCPSMRYFFAHTSQEITSM